MRATVLTVVASNAPPSTGASVRYGVVKVLKAETSSDAPLSVGPVSPALVAAHVPPQADRTHDVSDFFEAHFFRKRSFRYLFAIDHAAGLPLPAVQPIGQDRERDEGHDETPFEGFVAKHVGDVRGSIRLPALEKLFDSGPRTGISVKIFGLCGEGRNEAEIAEVAARLIDRSTSRRSLSRPG